MPAPPLDLHVLRTLTVGAVATTFQAAREGSPEVFVCKRLLPRFVRDPDARGLIAREANVLTRLRGRGAPLLAAAGEDAHGPFLVTERVGAHSLDTLRTSQPGGAWVAGVARAAFLALSAVHEADDDRGPLEIVHADLSPANVLVGDLDLATVVDFGHAHWRDAPSTAGGAFRGTMLYAAPELARGEAIDARADLFALAASILHAASGRPPRASSEPAAMLVEAAEVPLDGYAREASGVIDEETRAALARCLAFDREARPARARDVFGARA
jgi:serine/threonine protein kinase